jgi:hypothetical protein
MKNIIRKVLRAFNYDIVKFKTNLNTEFPSDFSDDHIKIINKAKPFTMTSNERLFALIEAIKYITKNKIQGDIVECGVWKGGSMLAAAECLIQQNDKSRNLYLYDTYEGMSEPSELDETYYNEKAESLLSSNTDRSKNLVWAYSALDEVKNTMSLSSYSPDLIHYVKVKVEDTIPNIIPKKIALLRLDTDWYESTKHEMEHLFPLLQNGGVLIIDDYGHWKGARKAIDEYFIKYPSPFLLNRIDETGRMGIKYL